MQQDYIGNQALPVMRPVIVSAPRPLAMGHTAYHHVGDVFDDAWSAGRVAAVGFATYHGYQRTRGNMPWVIVWALCAYVSPVVTTAVALAQRTVFKKGR